MTGPFLVRAGNWIFRWRNLAFPVAFLALILGTRPRLIGGSPAADARLDALGVLIAVLGQAVRAIVMGQVHIPRGGRSGKVHADSLVTDGIFAHCRNPLYVGNFLVFLGLLVVLNSPAGWIVGLPGVVFVYLSIARAEEAFLGATFGREYEAYRRRVPRFLPRLSGLREGLFGHGFDWRRVLRTEYGQAFAWTSAALLILLRERFANGAGDEVRAAWPAWAAAWGALVVLYGIVRFLKKTQRLRLS